MIARGVGLCALAFAAMLFAEPSDADEAQQACESPEAASLSDRPGTGRSVSTGGAPCVLPIGEFVVESGLRIETDKIPGVNATFVNGLLTFLRVGVAKRIEFGIAPPSTESRNVTVQQLSSAARGVADIILTAKYLVLDRASTQVSVGASYAPPTGTGDVTSGAPTYSVEANLGLGSNSRLSFAMSQVIGTSVGRDVDGLDRTFFVYTPSYTLSYALDNATTLIFQAALESRQGPTFPSGNHSLIGLQHAAGDRLALDIEYEKNLKPIFGITQKAIGFGFVWIAVPTH
jgi:hypothetical protein